MNLKILKGFRFYWRKYHLPRRDTRNGGREKVQKNNRWTKQEPFRRIPIIWPQRFGVQRSSMQAECDQEKISKSELTSPTKNHPVAIESGIPSRKSINHLKKLSSTTGGTKRSKQSSVGLKRENRA
ncbi:hypothetical protein JTB14_001349 [Gonioctena quinquepunctata]|nr:hypothetical protein JTB14_001349 [Gonioctena quinquepunctata]